LVLRKKPPLSPVRTLLSLQKARSAKMEKLVPFHGTQTVSIFALRLTKKADKMVKRARSEAYILI
jgi:hypothetical protein